MKKKKAKKEATEEAAAVDEVDIGADIGADTGAEPGGEIVQIVLTFKKGREGRVGVELIFADYPPFQCFRNCETL